MLEGKKYRVPHHGSEAQRGMETRTMIRVHQNKFKNFMDLGQDHFHA